MKLFRLFRRAKASPPKEAASLEKILDTFILLLRENNEVLELMADMEEKAGGRFLFDLHYLRSNSGLISEKVGRIIDYLNEIAPHKYEELKSIYDRIQGKIEKSLNQKLAIPRADYTIPLGQITSDMVLVVGGKSAQLGEMKNRLNLPVPDGFAITTYGYLEFLKSNDLLERIQARLNRSGLKEGTSLKEAGEEIKTWILKARIPPEMEEALRRAAQSLPVDPKTAGLALRSSGLMEDASQSFAGQYATFLNISPEKISEKYKEIVASQFGPKALFYMKNKGLVEEEMAMGVVCQHLVPAEAAGVLFTSHSDPEQGDRILINAVLGLGKAVVEGTASPDRYLLDKQTGRLIGRTIAFKIRKLVPDSRGGVEEQPVPGPLQSAPCLGEEPLRILWEWARKLEDHYGRPQDVEWVLDDRGRLYLLQSRNLRVGKKPESRHPTDRSDREKLLLEGGTVGSFGVGAGPVFHVRSEEDLNRFPLGGVLVAANTSPKFVSVMDRAAAIVTDIGSATGHMAILAREFQVPALVDTLKATQVLAEGREVTVDTFQARVYQGRIDRLLRKERARDPLLLDTPVYKKLLEVNKDIIPLNLTDPKLETFSPRYCQTLHDLTRFVHEMAIEEMFRLSDRQDLQKVSAVRINTTLPINLYVFDLGGGIEKNQSPQGLHPEKVLSLPFRALWKGMTYPGIRWAGPIGVNLKGLLSVMGQSATRPSDGFWDRTLGLVSFNYLNYSSRLGYHFSTVDSYCGPVRNDNYITFMFKGGAADGLRRGRRARFIGTVLDRLGFEVMIKEDWVKAQYRKYPQPMTEERLDYLGRLMGCARQLDMAMSDETMVDWYTQAFLSGNYAFKKEENKP